MALSSDLISQFVKITNDTKTTTKSSTVYGTVVISDGNKYVQLDGSPDGMLTPVETITDVEDSDRVIVDIQDHTATITGNLTTPSVNENSTVQNGDGTSTKITELGIVIADKVSTKTLNAEIARIDTLEANNATITGNVNANTASIGTLTAGMATIEGKLTAAEADIDELEANSVTTDTFEANNATINEKLSANEASINELDANYAEFKNTTTNNLEAINAGIENLETKKLDADKAEVTYANIDFSNIGDAAMKYLYTKSGLIENVTIGDGTITGNLVGVTISGDLIEGNTVKADKLVVLGSDGLYYKLNFESGNFTDAEEVPTDSLHGSIITANSITAEKVSVSDLVAFGAKIGGFTITDNSIYSGVKETIDNSTRGLYFDNDGQLCLGDATNFLRYYNDQKHYVVNYNSDTGEYTTTDEVITLKTNKVSRNLFPISSITTNEQFNGYYAGYDLQDEKIFELFNSLKGYTFTYTAEVDNTVFPWKGVTFYTADSYSVSNGYVGRTSPWTFTMPSDADDTTRQIEFLVRSDSTDANGEKATLSNIQFEFGSTAHDYEPWTGVTKLDDTFTTDGKQVYYSSDPDVGYCFFTSEDDYKLEIAAESILFGVNSKTSAEDLKNIIEHIHIGTYTDPDTGEDEPSISLYEDDTDFKQIITNTKTIFTDGSVEHTAIRTDGITTENVAIKNELQHGEYVWSIRANGNYGLMWKGE